MEERTGTGTSLDKLALELQQLRAHAGSPSYAEIVVRIARHREAAGVPPEVARPGRTTVYDAFRTGRRRIDADLVVEIVRALGVDDAEAIRWMTACREAQHEVGDRLPGQPTPAAEPMPAAARRVVRPVQFVAGLLVVCVVLNLVGRVLVDALNLPLYLDMTGTAIAALVLGPWSGVAVAIVTNLAGTLVSGPASIPFVLVNVVGALVWGYGVRRFGFGRTIPRYFLLNVAVAVACTMVAAPIIVLVFDGVGGNGADSIAETIESISHSLVVSVFSANLVTSLSDKLISGFVALVVVESLPRHLTQWPDQVAPAPSGPVVDTRHASRTRTPTHPRGVGARLGRWSPGAGGVVTRSRRF